MMMEGEDSARRWACLINHLLTEACGLKHAKSIAVAIAVVVVVAIVVD